jgi:hypothetical protein
VNLGLNPENKAASLILAVEGYAAYALLVANMLNAVQCVLRLSLTTSVVFAVTLGVTWVERRFTRVASR